MKPRCPYTDISLIRMKPHATIGDPEPTAQAIRLCREYTMENFEEAKIASKYYVCVMQPFAIDDPMHGSDLSS